MLKISIAMSTYNGEKYVEKQLLSLLNQTRKADEVIIADDVSSDQTPQIVQNFIKEHNLEQWKFTVNKQNLGYKKNFYEVIKKTTGDLIFLCDQDDIWLPQKLEKMEKVFETNPEVMCLNSSFDFIDKDDNSVPFEISKTKSNNNLINAIVEKDSLYKIAHINILHGNISPGCTSAFTKKIKDSYIEDPNDKLPHDWVINIYACFLEGLFFYNKPLILYRIHDKNQIGLKVHNHIDLKIKGNLETRFKILEEQNAFVALCKSDFLIPFLSNKELEFISAFEKYIKTRKICLAKVSIKNYLKLCFYYFLVKESSTVKFRGLLGDLKFMLRKKRD